MTMTDVEKSADETGAERTDDAGALYALGTRYSTGRDVEHDLICAHKWFNLAAMMGHEEARIARAELAREMGAADIAEAQRQARAWLWSRANAKPAEDVVSQPATPLAKDKQKTAAGSSWRGNSRSLCA
jgi:uncharacterized protein